MRGKMTYEANGKCIQFLPVRLPNKKRRGRGLKPKFPGAVCGFISQNAGAIQV
jgi:hypothetical protein